MNTLFRGLVLFIASPVLLVIHLADAIKRRTYRKRARH